MSARSYAALFVVGLLVMAVGALALPAPGYMDAEYYFATARQLVHGRGFVEPFIWNFLSNPASIPTVSHTYWQPLASLIQAVAMAAFGEGFRAAQVASVMLAALLPVLSARLAVSLGEPRPAALIAGGLALLPGFFAPYLVTTDTFAVYAVVGGVLWWQIAEAQARPTKWRWMALGALVALGSLARADGLLLWVPVGLALLSTDPGRRWPAAGLAFGAFAVMMAPWWARNLAVTGSVLGSGAGRALWLLEYDELFTYPASGLTFDRWWAAGLAAHVQPRLAALWTNLQSVIAVNGYVLLLPLMLIGGWHHRKRLTVRAAAVYAAALYLVMSLVFPFAGARGGLFHSSAAVMPLLYALAASGLEISARWLAPRRGWDPGRTRSLLLTATVALAVMLSLWTVLSKTGLFGKGTSFARNQDTYQTAGELLAAEVDRSSVIAVGDPPGYFLATGSPAVVIPHGDESVLQQAAAEFGIEWIVLEADHPRGLRELYDAPGRRSWLAEPLSYLDPSGRPVYLYRVALEGG